jgi:hypothetical protein
MYIREISLVTCLLKSISLPFKKNSGELAGDAGVSPGDVNAGTGDDPNSTASSDLSLSMSRHAEPREDPEVIKLWKENQVIFFSLF